MINSESRAAAINSSIGQALADGSLVKIQYVLTDDKIKLLVATPHLVDGIGKGGGEEIWHSYRYCWRTYWAPVRAQRYCVFDDTVN